MITIPAGAHVLLATRPVDFRKGAHGLAALVSAVLGEDPFSGTVVVFRCPVRRAGLDAGADGAEDSHADRGGIGFTGDARCT